MNKRDNNLGNPHLRKANLRKELNKYSKHWPYFLLVLGVCILSANLYLRYTTPVYKAHASILIVDDGGNKNGPAQFAEFALTGMSTKNLENETGFLKSRRLMVDVVKSLNLNVQYFQEEKFRNVELYDNVPFIMQILKLDEHALKNLGSVNFQISPRGDNYRILNLNSQKTIPALPGVPVNIGFADIVITPNSNYSKKGTFEAVTVKFSQVEKMASKYQNKLVLKQSNKTSGILELTMEDPVKEKARDILDQLILQYNRTAVEEKHLIAGNTANFINERLEIINKELDEVETGKEAFKERNQLTDIQTQSQIFVQNANDYNKKRQEVATQLELSNAMLEYLTKTSESNLLPTNLGIAEAGVNAQINEYNNLVLERNRILAGSSEKNPVVIRLNNNINQIKSNVVQSFQNMRSNLQIGQDDLTRQASSIGSQIYAVPGKERQFRGIERQQNIKETLYLFLLQKREENSLALANTEPKAKIIDRAYFESSPVFPNSRNIYLGSAVLGIFLPISFIYIIGLLDNKIRSKSDIENITREIPIVGIVPKIDKKKVLIENNDRSVLAEAFRILLTNMQYLLVNIKSKKEGVCLIVTSTTKGEGKTFTAINLSVTLANSGKKVLLMGADLRNPKLQAYQIEKNIPGLSDYLVNDNLELYDLIGTTSIHPEIAMITSGKIPPNPYELLKQEKIGDLLRELKSMYDYVIVDTAPSLLVADTFLITKFADLVIYMVRAGLTETEMLEFPLIAHEEGKLKNVNFVLNDVKLSNLGYGNKYGYGYGSSTAKISSSPGWVNRRFKPAEVS